MNPIPQVVRTNVKGAKIVIKKDLTELSNRINSKNLHGEVDWGKREGSQPPRYEQRGLTLGSGYSKRR